MKAIESIAQACAGAGKPWGIFSRGPEYAVRMRSMGCQLFVLGADIHAMHAGIRNVKERYAAFFGRPRDADGQSWPPASITAIGEGMNSLLRFCSIAASTPVVTRR